MKSLVPADSCLAVRPSLHRRKYPDQLVISRDSDRRLVRCPGAGTAARPWPSRFPFL